jgi:hypothetical protein
MALNLIRKKLDVQSNNKKKPMADEKEPVEETPAEEKKEETCDCEPAAFVSYIFACRNIVHMLHLNTKSFAAHKALDTYYNEVVDIIDSIAEVQQGFQGSVLKGYKDFPLAKYEDYDPVTYLKEVREYVQEYRYKAFPKDYSPIQNELDNLENLLNSTLYKLEQLK